MKVWKVVVDGKCRGVFTAMSDANRAAQALSAKNSWSKVEVVTTTPAKVAMRRTIKKVAKAPTPRVRFKEPTGRLTVPVGTLVAVFRNVNTEKKVKGWVKYKLKKERTFFECHQVTSMNKGLLENDTIKMLTSNKWMVFHTEDPNYPLIAFSAYTTEFPMAAANLGMRFENGMLPEDALPYHTPLKYPPHGNSFGRLFNEQKNAFLHKVGFNAGLRLRKERKELDSDES